MTAIVDTHYGRLAGGLDRGVHVFRGIPYARAPIGPLRFQAPQPPEPWTGVRDCTRFAPGAPQNPPRLPTVYGSRVEEQDESCLTLNVWTPDLEGMPRPVIVWLHGGGFVEGSAAEPGHCGRALARRGDAVVVSVQYRLGALGFLHLADVCDDDRLTTANAGLLDQIAALRFVQQEIDAFGGDPSNVTLIGSGAGATSIGCLLAQDEARSMIRRVVVQSGRHAALPRSRAAAVASAFLDACGVAPRDAGRLLELPVDALLDAQARVRASRRGAFAPVIDGAVLPEAPLAALDRGVAAGIPCIVGSNRDEARVRDIEPGVRRPGTLDETVAAVEALLGDAAKDGAHEVVAAYRARRADAPPHALLRAIETDVKYRLPAIRLAEAQSRNESRVFSYLLHWNQADARDATWPGAFHGIDVPLALGTVRHHPLARYAGPADAARALSRRVRDAWSAFARSGRPDDAATWNWPGFEGSRRRTLVFDEHPKILDAPDAEELDVLERQLA